MSFNVAPKAGTTAPSDGQSSAAQSARARAIAALSGSMNQSQATPVPNANAVAPEDMAAVSTPSPESVGQSIPNEAAPTETPEPPKEATTDKAEPLSAQYAQLARKEKALRAEALKLKAERDAWKAEQTAVAKPQAPTPVDPSQFIPKDRLTKDTWAVLNELGISYDQLTQAALNAPSPEAQAQQAHIAKLEAKLAALEEKQTTTEKSYEENQKQGYQQALNQIRADVKRVVASDPEAYETIATTQSADDVVDLIERTFKEDGVLMTVEEAAQAVEEHLAEEAYKLAKLNKIQKRLAPAPTAQAAPAKTAPATPQQQTPKTLTNAASASRPMTVRERAIAAAEGRLNK